MHKAENAARLGGPRVQGRRERPRNFGRFAAQIASDAHAHGAHVAGSLPPALDQQHAPSAISSSTSSLINTNTPSRECDVCYPKMPSDVSLTVT